MQTVPAGTPLRIPANSPFLLHWTTDDWQHSTDTRSQGTAIGIEFVDIPVSGKQKDPKPSSAKSCDSLSASGIAFAVDIPYPGRIGSQLFTSH